MISALFTAFFFGITPVVAGRAIALVGFVRANVIRLSFAVLILGVWAFAFGQGMRGQTLLFIAAGGIGFGIGGLALLASLSRLGAPLASLIEETIAAAVAGIVAWFWYGDKLTTLQLELCGVILAGVVIGLLSVFCGPPPPGGGPAHGWGGRGAGRPPPAGVGCGLFSVFPPPRQKGGGQKGGWGGGGGGFGGGGGKKRPT